MSTSISNTSPYITTAQFIQLWDVRPIGDLFLDNGNRASSSDITTASTQANNTWLLHAGIGAGWIEAACLRGDRYTPADLLTNLTGNSQQLLAWMNGALLLKSLYRRRSGKRPYDELKADIEEATGLLQELADGTMIFAFQEAADAGVAEHQVEQASDVEARDLVSYQLHRFFARRGNRRSTARHS